MEDTIKLPPDAGRMDEEAKTACSFDCAAVE